MPASSRLKPNTSWVRSLEPKLKEFSYVKSIVTSVADELLKEAGSSMTYKAASRAMGTRKGEQDT